GDPVDHGGTVHLRAHRPAPEALLRPRGKPRARDRACPDRRPHHRGDALACPAVPARGELCARRAALEDGAADRRADCAPRHHHPGGALAFRRARYSKAVKAGAMTQTQENVTSTPYRPEFGTIAGPAGEERPQRDRRVAVSTRDLNAWYGAKHALTDITIEIE